MSKCRICKGEYAKRNMRQVVCSPDCAIEMVKQKREKQFRQAHRKALNDAKTRQDWIKEVQTVFNKWIRIRDENEPCISCGRYHKGQHHAGHYLATSVRPDLRFAERNVHKQCAPCNTHLHGNLIQYRYGLINRIGIEEVEQMESECYEPRKYTIEELKELKRTYLEKIKNGTKNKICQ